MLIPKKQGRLLRRISFRVSKGVNAHKILLNKDSGSSFEPPLSKSCVNSIYNLPKEDYGLRGYQDFWRCNHVLCLVVGQSLLVECIQRLGGHRAVLVVYYLTAPVQYDRLRKGG